ncbi:2Fe-2S iron-sulfur cluster-binding protein [Streptomyces sp. GESEQ-35]|uniref:2Fe-2S iron-sulfur cluster-binding protein n=1 Tax=Streptomyces sp. GESEQ-35 TaxID=2812657 RepID=UPI001B32A42E|nr:2Fe-2S iron-sulfur cluster-binding protein [Streptomyces sp. GESEQ-35]
MTDDQHGEGAPQGGGRWDPLPQGDYDDGATAFVKLPEGGIEALLASVDPLAAPGHGYVPPPITANPAPPAGPDPAAPGGWPAPADGVQWPDPNAAPQDAGSDRFGYNPGATGQWNFETVEGSAGSAADHAAAPGHDVTGQWSIPVAGGDLPDESGEFTTSSLVEQWGGTPPATLPGGAAAPWATEGAGQPWGQDAAHTATPAEAAGPAVDAPPGHTHGEVSAQAYTRAHPGTPAQQHGDTTAQQHAVSPAQPHTDGRGDGAAQPHADTRAQQHPQAHPSQRPGTPAQPHAETRGETDAQHAQAHAQQHGDAPAQQHGEAPARHPHDQPHAQQPADGRAPAAARSAHETAVAAAQLAQKARDAAEAAEGAQGATEAAEGAVEPSVEPEPGADAEAGDERGASQTPGDTPTPPGEEHPLASYVLRVNGVERPVTDAWIGESLLYVLRERLGLAGAKDGCSQGECGACNVQVDGRLVASCLVPAVTAAGSEVRTVEGLAEDGQPSDVQRALARCGAVQCGFCVPGMAMTVHDLLEGNPAPTELEARQALCGNLCRCSGYRGVLDAVKDVVAEREAHSTADSETNSDEARIPHQAGPGAGGVNPSAFEPHDQAYGQDGGQA